MIEASRKIIPVIDLKGGLVVRAVAGRRDDYQPVASSLCAGPAPGEVAAALRDRVACERVYVADLDAIAGVAFNREAWMAIADCGFRLIIDAGLHDLAQLEVVQRFDQSTQAVDGIVVALESIASLDGLEHLIRHIGASRAVFSLDLRDGQPITAVPELAGAPPERIAEVAVGFGYERLIVLDLAAVGVFEGPRTATLVRQLRRRFANLQIVAGGGVRHCDDLRSLIDAGCDGVLVASALHNGMLP